MMLHFVKYTRPMFDATLQRGQQWRLTVQNRYYKRSANGSKESHDQGISA